MIINTDSKVCEFKVGYKRYTCNLPVDRNVNIKDFQTEYENIKNSISEKKGKDWESVLRIYDPKKRLDDFGYEDCENAIALMLKGKVVARHEENNCQGIITLIIQTEAGEYYTGDYEWGSCGECDTLLKDGSEATCDYIYNNLLKME